MNRELHCICNVLYVGQWIVSSSESPTKCLSDRSLTYLLFVASSILNKMTHTSKNLLTGSTYALNVSSCSASKTAAKKAKTLKFYTIYKSTMLWYGYIIMLWFHFFFFAVLKFSNQFNFYFPLCSIYYHNLRQREVKIKLVWCRWEYHTTRYIALVLQK